MFFKSLVNQEDRITSLGNAQVRGKSQKFGIKYRDRATHMYIVGKSGMGKSTLLENMAVQDILAGEGIMFYGSTWSIRRDTT